MHSTIQVFRITNLPYILVIFYLALSFNAYADDSVIVKTQAQKVKGDLKSARKSYKKLLNQGRKLTQKKKYQEAINVYHQVLRHDPNNSTVLGELGFTSFRMGKYKIAQKAAWEGLCSVHIVEAVGDDTDMF